MGRQCSQTAVVTCLHQVVKTGRRMTEISVRELTGENVDEDVSESIGEHGLRKLAVVALDDVSKTVDVRVGIKFH